MGIKRPLMILGSTVGAVAAVLSYHPAASGTSAALGGAPLGGASDANLTTDTLTTATDPSPTPSATTSTPAPTPTQSTSQSSTPATTSTKKKSQQKQQQSSTAKSSASSSTSSNSANATTDTTTQNAPEPAPVTPSPTPTPTQKATAKDQVVSGATAQTRWGPVQVQITVKDGKIVDAVGLQYPNGDRRSQWISQQAVPWLVEETLNEQVANVTIIGGATYTSMGWRQSLASAMQKAGL